MAMITPLFPQAGLVQGGGRVDDAGIERVFARRVEPAGPESGGERAWHRSGAPRLPTILPAGG